MTGLIKTQVGATEPQTTLTISSGVITVTQKSHEVAAETGLTDDLDTINVNIPDLSTYDFEIILTAAPGDTITVKNGTGNIVLNADIVLTEDQRLPLYYKTSTDTWYDMRTSSAEGETNTASNQGTDGVGVYDTKVGVDLQFRNVAPGSANVTTTLNTKDIDIDVVLPINFKTGLNISRLSDTQITIGTGSANINGVIYNTTTQTTLTITTAGSWIGGSSLESASEWIHVYQEAGTGLFRLSDRHPQYSNFATGNRVAWAQVNQAGWNGTSGNGLNATSVVYNNDTTEANIEAGMYMLIYDDSGYTLGRGKYKSGTASVNHLSIAKITAIDTGTNTITLQSGHNIAINDDDYFIVVEAGEMIARYDGSTWYRWIGALWNDSSSNLTNYKFYQHDCEVVLTQAAFFADVSTSISISSLPTGWNNCLYYEWDLHGLRCDRAANFSDAALLQFNSDATAGNYDTQYNTATAAIISAAETIGTVSGFRLPGAIAAVDADSGNYSVVNYKIYRPSDTNELKHVNGTSRLNGTTTGELTVSTGGGVWESTAAINTLTILPQNGSNFEVGDADDPTCLKYWLKGRFESVYPA